MEKLKANKKRIDVINVLLSLAIIYLGGCQNDNDCKKTIMEIDMEQLSFEHMNKIKNVSILFGHQSVGNDILEGVKTFFESHHDFPPLAIKSISLNDSVEGPGLYEARIGRNKFPDTKIENFKKLVFKNGNNLDFAFMKFCYIDVDESSEVVKIFRSYVKMIDQIKTTFPKIQIIHFTVPLQSHYSGRKEWLMSFFKPDFKNINKWKLNQLLRAKYQNEDLLFDLARIESTCKDGSRKVLTQKGVTFEVLNDEYTDDGGHLNKTGQKVVAIHLLRFIDSVYSKK